MIRIYNAINHASTGAFPSMNPKQMASSLVEEAAPGRHAASFAVPHMVHVLRARNADKEVHT